MNAYKISTNNEVGDVAIKCLFHFMALLTIANLARSDEIQLSWNLTHVDSQRDFADYPHVQPLLKFVQPTVYNLV